MTARFPGSRESQGTIVAVKKTVKKTDTEATGKAASKPKAGAAKASVEKADKAEKTTKPAAGKKAGGEPSAAKKAPAKQAASKSATGKSKPEKQEKPEKPAKASAASSKADKKKTDAKAEKSKASPGKVLRAVAAVPKGSPIIANKKAPKYKVDEETGRPVLPKGYQPSADEEYMNPLQLEYFRQKLVARREELIEESKQTIENLKDEVRDIGDEAERASRETENALELRTRDRYRKLIGKIDSVIRRVDEGDYGYCVDSGEEIGLERLEARPEAERTIDAQERWEIRRKQLGD
ncbi:RNA polymerase-binding protein DksA [Lysobacteraceae bacterium NML120232]|nr:RNA polymerase-binding protein DksA [Xanthomonadaceae bacterium NML120232]